MAAKKVQPYKCYEADSNELVFLMLGLLFTESISKHRPQKVSSSQALICKPIVPAIDRIDRTKLIAYNSLSILSTAKSLVS